MAKATFTVKFIGEVTDVDSFHLQRRLDHLLTYGDVLESLMSYGIDVQVAVTSDVRVGIDKEEWPIKEEAPEGVDG